MYEFFFYSILLLSTAFVLKSFIGKKIWRPRVWIGKLLKSSGVGVLALTALLFWSLQILEFTAPKGSMLHELVRIPAHFHHLRQYSPTSMQINRIAYGPHKRHYMMVCSPTEEQNNLKDKAVFYIHGGGWHVGSPEKHFKLAELLTAEGYTVYMPAYRLGPFFNSYDLRQDIEAALLLITRILEEENPSCSKSLVIGGTSAGANLAALLLYDRSELNRIGLSQSLFAGFFSLAGALDINSMPLSAALRNYAGEKHKAQFAEANPIGYLQADENLPVLCMHGTKDGLVNFDAAASFVAALQRINPNLVQMHPIANATHIEVATSWYYDPKADFGQAETLLNWLSCL